MLNKKFLSRIVSLSVALTLTCNMFPMQSLSATESVQKENMEKEDQEVIEINTIKDFLTFADNCFLDVWSSNKMVVLNTDIDLSDTDFKSIQVFTGTFDGRNHTISGFLYDGDGYVAGLFRYIEKDGLVKNLKLKGDVIASDEKECIGGLCGVNYGTIKNCSFQGNVSGKNTVGGLVGINEGTGVIQNSFAGGSITGYYSTGGIVGKNHGELSYCTNHACVNNDSEWVEEDDEMGVGLFLSINISESETELFSGVDTGGIAGYSDGVITKCANYSKIGYEHTGYNIGGIAGRGSGVVSSCTNLGEVYGRKDVGGIVGQMEPYIEVDEAQSLRNAVNKLHDLIEKTIDDMQDGKNVIKEDLDNLAVYSEGATDAGDALAGQITDFVDNNLDQVQAIADRLDRVMDMLPTVFDDIYEAEENFANANSTLMMIGDNFKDIGNISGEYVETDYSRVALLSTVGGNILSIQHYPEAGETVQIMAEPNNGYILDQLKVVDANGNSVSVQKEDDRNYTFIMPEANVRVEAYFSYQSTRDDNYCIEGTVQATDDEKASNKEENEESDADDIFMENKESGSDNSEAGTSDDKENNESFIGDGETEEISGETDKNVNDDGDNGETASTDIQEIQISHSTYTATRLMSTDFNAIAEIKTIEFSTESQESERAFERAGDVVVKLSSNLSGNASYEIDGTTAILTVIPDGAYAVSGIPKVVTDGQTVPVEKTNKSEYAYTFQVNNGGTYEVNIVFKKRDKSQLVNSAKGDISSAIKEQQAATEKVNTIIREIQSNSSASPEQLEELEDALEEMLNATSAVMSDLSVVSNIVGQQVLYEMEDIGDNLINTLDHLQNAVENVKSATRDARSIVNYVNEQPDIHFSKLGEEFDVNRKNLYSQLKGMSDSIKSMSDNASNYSDVVNDDLRAVNDQINIIFNLLADNLTNYDEISVEELYEDVDIEDTESITTGKTENCINKGIIKGDINVGGIAGAMSIDEEDPEDSAAGSVEYQIGRRYFTKCIITDSVNEGYVTAKKNGAGGVVGYMRHGVVVDSEGYGSVESTEGDYVGGICGESFTVIKRCYALCSVSGGKNVGGIAGFADTLKDCYAIVDCNASIGRKGAIAGQIVNYNNLPDEEEVKVSGNYYVGDNLYGIDNISYIGIAEPISYDEMLTVANLPRQFWHMKVIFRVDDLYLGEQEVKFGESLSELNYPSIPEKEGYYGVWPDYSDKVMAGNLLIKGEYKEDVTVIQSNGKQTLGQEGERERPYALVEQHFTEDTILDVSISDMEPPKEAINKEYVIYNITLRNALISDTDTYAIRLYNPYEDASVWGYKNGIWTELESKVRGQYLQVSMTGAEQTFCIIEHKAKLWIVVCDAAGGFVVLILLVIFGKKIKSKKHSRKKVQD